MLCRSRLGADNGSGKILYLARYERRQIVTYFGFGAVAHCGSDVRQGLLCCSEATRREKRTRHFRSFITSCLFHGPAGRKDPVSEPLRGYDRRPHFIGEASIAWGRPRAEFIGLQKTKGPMLELTS
jgi:hypothetical protein